MGQLRLDFYQISVLEKNIFHFTFSEVQTGCHILALFWKKIVSKIEVVKNVNKVRRRKSLKNYHTLKINLLIKSCQCKVRYFSNFCCLLRIISDFFFKFS